ncbi:hypothetical protein METUNv1_01218 [Methyloversatilis universalis FAM5]|uniref:Uncharacterized protein n=1 Tax=Methyloversatilis universalis (strain ATCC BAA-1314 / DSM 25237 / JCM 13912 / CCUG 52030 / FAM5) TaxID=1000565 RepID=F5RAK4_METUF|nr:hypothetical protein [Methyloversatilis universalis]EGK72453.1 hypothetical protein METUNv1_01218 [Methyloversatilis universalis FAM5]
MGLLSSSKSKSSTYNTTTINNIDRRIVADGMSSVFAPDISIGGAGSSLSITNVDPALIKAAADMVSQSNDTLRAGYSDLAASYLSLIQSNERQNDTLQANVLRVLDATGDQFKDATDTAVGNKPLIYAGLLIAGVVALQAMR